MSVKIIRVVHENGNNALIGNAVLFEIASGRGQGLRGTDYQIFDLVGPIVWDREHVSIYETGDMLPIWMVKNVS